MTLDFKLPPGWHLIRWEQILMVIKTTDQAASAIFIWNLLNLLLKTIFQENVSQVKCLRSIVMGALFLNRGECQNLDFSIMLSSICMCYSL